MSNIDNKPKKINLKNKNVLSIVVVAVLIVLIIAVSIVVAVVIGRNNREINVYFMNGDELVKKITITRKDDVELEMLSRDGYRFLGWTPEGGDQVIDQKFFTNYDYLDDVTLYATWEMIDPVTVTYDARGGSAVAPIETPKGYPFETMGMSIRDGYVLLGWTYDIDCLRVYNEHIVTDNMTLYAKWIPKEISDTAVVEVKYETGNELQLDSTEIKIGNELTYPEVHYSGYSLEGWYCDREFVYKPDPDVLVTQSCTVYAKWAKIDQTYKITFVAPENAPLFSTRDYLYDEHIVRGDFDFTWNEFHELVGVFEDPEYQKSATFDYYIREDHTYYLQYNELTAVRVSVYYYDGDEMLSDQIYSEGDPIAYYDAPQKEGYNFDGWYADKELTTLFDFDNTKANNGLKIYAKYSLKLQYEDECLVYEKIVDADNGDYLKAVAEKDRSSLSVVIADTCNGLEVREIASELFQGRYLQSLTIGKNVRVIGLRAFESVNFDTVNGDRSIIIPASVRMIGWRAFFGSNIAEVNIEGQPIIEEYAFAQCVSLKTFSAPDVLSIGDNAFESCYNLETVNVRSVTSLGEGLFKECINLKTIDLSSTSINTLPNSIFYGCNSLTTFVIPSSVTTLGTNCFGSSGLTTINTNNVCILSSSTFGGCRKLKNVIIGKALEKIDPSSFAECDALESFTVAAANAYFSSNGDGCLYNKVFVDGDETSQSFYPTKLLLYASVSSEYILPKTIVEIEPQAFAYTQKLKVIKVAEGNAAFVAFEGNLYDADMTVMIHYASAKDDTEFFVPDTVSKIASFCFMEASNLECVYLGEKVKTLAVWAFYGLNSLQKIVCATNDVAILNGDEVVEMVSVYRCPHAVIEYPADVE